MLFRHFSAISRSAPANSGLRTANGFLSYHELLPRVHGLASGLLEKGIGVGDHVAILLNNGPDFFTCVQAVAGVGAIVVPVNGASGESELDWIAGKCRFRAVIFAKAFAKAAQRIREETTLMVPLEGNDASSLASLMATPKVELPEIDGDTTASYLLSSGSTGRPKLVPHSHRVLVACGRVAAESLDLQADDMVLNVLPAHHSFGYLNGCFEVPFRHASTLFWTESGPLILSRNRLFDVINRYRISVMPGVPFIFKTLCSGSDRVNLPSLRLVYSSGIALKKDIFDDFQRRFGLTLVQGYGCTETGMLALSGMGGTPSPWNSVGRPARHVSMELLPVKGQEEGTGEIFVRTPALISGYVDAEDSGNDAFVDGGYRTGDLGRFDAEGNLYIVGRIKLLLEVAGEKVDPYEIEDVLCTHGDVAEAVIVGRADPGTGEQRLHGIVVARAGKSPAPDALIAFCRGRLQPFKVPHSIEFRTSIPKSSTGKVLRSKL